jgi:hypothetical protein
MIVVKGSADKRDLLIKVENKDNPNVLIKTERKTATVRVATEDAKVNIFPGQWPNVNLCNTPTIIDGGLIM